MPWPPPVTIATRPSSLLIGESIVAPPIQTEDRRRNGREATQGTREGRAEDAHGSARQGLGREVAGQRRRLQPRVQRAPAHLLLERHLEPPGTLAQDALDAEPRHAHGARQGARAQAPHPRRPEQRRDQGRDQGSVHAGGRLRRRAGGGGGVPLRARGIRIERIAFIGLGTMGVPMAANLSAAGFRVQSYDARGTGTHGSARAAVEGADVLLTMLPDGEAVREVVLEALPALKRGALVIDMSSSDPVGTQALLSVLSAKSISIVDAPVSGALPKAKDGTLAIMVGGSAEDVQRARPVLEKLGRDIFHVGPVGAGHVVKALNNYLGAAGTLAGFEALLLARAFGLEPQPMLDAINVSSDGTATTERKIPLQILTGAFASGFKLALWRDAAKRLPRNADHTEIYKYQLKLGTRRKRKR